MKDHPFPQVKFLLSVFFLIVFPIIINLVNLLLCYYVSGQALLFWGGHCQLQKYADA